MSLNLAYIFFTNYNNSNKIWNVIFFFHRTEILFLVTISYIVYVYSIWKFYCIIWWERNKFHTPLCHVQTVLYIHFPFHLSYVFHYLIPVCVYSIKQKHTCVLSVLRIKIQLFFYPPLVLNFF